jgi:hypothetical protein
MLRHPHRESRVVSNRRVRLFFCLYPGKVLPEFKWLQVFGTPGQDDFGISKDYRLVVSERILNTLKLYGLSHCDINAWTKD